MANKEHPKDYFTVGVMDLEPIQITQVANVIGRRKDTLTLQPKETGKEEVSKTPSASSSHLIDGQGKLEIV